MHPSVKIRIKLIMKYSHGFPQKYLKFIVYQLKYLTFLFSFLPLVRSGERTEILLVSPEHATGLIHPNLDCLAEYISKYLLFI